MRRGDELKVLAANGDDRLVVRHTADHQQVMGVLRPVRDGEPITGDVLSVEPIDEANGVYRVKDQFSATGKSHSGAVTDNFRRAGTWRSAEIDIPWVKRSPDGAPG
jgi:hypothetical protein